VRKWLRRRDKTSQQAPSWCIDLLKADTHSFVIGGVGTGKTVFMLDPYQHEKKAARQRTPELLDRPENYSWPNRVVGKLVARIFARG